MSDLKNCPFCGAKPFVTRDCGFEIGCSTVDCSNYMVERGNWDLAMAAWNRRAPSPAMLALVEASKRASETCDCVYCFRLREAIDAVEKELHP